MVNGNRLVWYQCRAATFLNSKVPSITMGQHHRNSSKWAKKIEGEDLFMKQMLNISFNIWNMKHHPPLLHSSLCFFFAYTYGNVAIGFSSSPHVFTRNLGGSWNRRWKKPSDTSRLEYPTASCPSFFLLEIPTKKTPKKHHKKDRYKAPNKVQYEHFEGWTVHR